MPNSKNIIFECDNAERSSIPPRKPQKTLVASELAFGILGMAQQINLIANTVGSIYELRAVLATQTSDEEFATIQKLLECIQAIRNQKAKDFWQLCRNRWSE